MLNIKPLIGTESAIECNNIREWEDIKKLLEKHFLYIPHPHYLKDYKFVSLKTYGYNPDKNKVFSCTLMKQRTSFETYQAKDFISLNDYEVY